VELVNREEAERNKLLLEILKQLEDNKQSLKDCEKLLLPIFKKLYPPKKSLWKRLFRI
jgi:predicted YcjX-like family ATPase